MQTKSTITQAQAKLKQAQAKQTLKNFRLQAKDSTEHIKVKCCNLSPQGTRWH